MITIHKTSHIGNLITFWLSIRLDKMFSAVACTLNLWFIVPDDLIDLSDWRELSTVLFNSYYETILSEFHEDLLEKSIRLDQRGTNQKSINFIICALCGGTVWLTKSMMHERFRVFLFNKFLIRTFRSISFLNKSVNRFDSFV